MLRWWHLDSFDFIIQTEKQKGRLFEMTFGEKLKAIRKEKGYSQEEMAGLLDVSRHEPAIIRLNQEKPTKSRVCTDSVLFI